MQNQKPLVSPPPPYTTTQHYNPLAEDIHPDNDIDTNTDDEDTWATTPTPITINIDASISMQGNNNAIIMTSGSPSVSTSSTTSSPASTSMLQAVQKHRQNRITEMATSIIQALKNSETNGKELIEININTGMKIEGSRNVISVGAACHILPRAKRHGQSHNDDEDGSRLKRRKRAQSVAFHITLITLLRTNYLTWLSK